MSAKIVKPEKEEKKIISLPSIVPPLREFEIPSNRVAGCLNLIYKNEIATRDGIGQQRIHYRIWLFISKLFPETLDGIWRVEARGTRYFVVEEHK